MTLLPLWGGVQTSPDEPRVIELDDDVADIAFEALSASAARNILSLLYEQPLIPTAIQEKIESSFQNVHYHLEKLEDADLIKPSGIGYSEKGTEMTVYAPAKEAVVLFAGEESDHLCVRDHLQ